MFGNVACGGSIKASLPVIDELVVAKYGDGPVRVASDESELRVFRAEYPFTICRYLAC
jgi:hypothetical protein